MLIITLSLIPMRMGMAAVPITVRYRLSKIQTCKNKSKSKTETELKMKMKTKMNRQHLPTPIHPQRLTPNLYLRITTTSAPAPITPLAPHSQQPPPHQFPMDQPQWIQITSDTPPISIPALPPPPPLTTLSSTSHYHPAVET